MAKEQILAKGLRFFDKNAAAPEFVLGTVVITFEEVRAMFNENVEHLTEYNGAKQLRLQMLRSKEGKTYFSVDTYKKGDASNSPYADAVAKANAANAATPTPAEAVDDLPF